jgi:predicted AAA+ superfamily ATPase
MIIRRIQQLIQDRLSHMPGVVLLGPRQVGKTTLAKHMAAARNADTLYLDMERPMCSFLIS